MHFRDGAARNPVAIGFIFYYQGRCRKFHTGKHLIQTIISGTKIVSRELERCKATGSSEMRAVDTERF